MRNVKSIVIYLVIALTSAQALAEDYIYAGGWSQHFGSSTMRNGSKIVNQQHNLIGYERNDYIIASFKNSFGDDSYALGKTFDVMRFGDLRLRAALVGVYGYYSCTDSKGSSLQPVWCPRVLPMVVYTKYSIQPAVATFGDAVVLTIRWQF